MAEQSVDQALDIAANRAQQDSQAPTRGEGKLVAGGVEFREIEELKEQVKRGDLSGLRAYMTRSRAEGDWQDRVYVLEEVTPSIRLADLEFACDVERESADLFVIRCAFFSELAWKRRGGGTADKVTVERFRDAGACLAESMKALQVAVRLDNEDPTVSVLVMSPLIIFCVAREVFEVAYHAAVAAAPGLVPAHRMMVNALTKRWGGSHEKSLEFARAAMAKAEPGSDMAVCLFWAHTQIRTHFKAFDGDAAAGARYLQDLQVREELNAAFDAWTGEDYRARRSSVPYLHTAACWYYLARDKERLRRALELTGGEFVAEAWRIGGDGRRIYRDALLFAGLADASSEEGAKNDLCLTLIEKSVDALTATKAKEPAQEQAGLEQAEKCVVMGLALAKALGGEREESLSCLGKFSLSLLRTKQKRLEEAKAAREEGLALLEGDAFEDCPQKWHVLMARMLTALGEHGLAIRFWEEGIERAGTDEDALRMAGLLGKLGQCYQRLGQNDHAAIPLRMARKILEGYPADPNTPTILLLLGVALKARFPVEAEECYLGSAAWLMARSRYDAATPSWMNLGTLLSDQGRFGEALEHYERVLKIREQSQAKAPDSTKLAAVLNNIAGCYRKMGRLEVARAYAERAIGLFQAQDAGLAYAWNTLGEILLDAGNDVGATSWFRKGLERRMEAPSPNLEAVGKDWETLIPILERLGRSEEVVEAKRELERVRGLLAAAQGTKPGISEVNVRSQGAVFVELGFGAGGADGEMRQRVYGLIDRLSQGIADAGRFAGRTTFPEGATLIFYGEDAEVLFAAMEPALSGSGGWPGAVATISQGGKHREVTVGGRRLHSN